MPGCKKRKSDMGRVISEEGRNICECSDCSKHQYKAIRQ